MLQDNHGSFLTQRKCFITYKSSTTLSPPPPAWGRGSKHMYMYYYDFTGYFTVYSRQIFMILTTHSIVFYYILVNKAFLHNILFRLDILAFVGDFGFGYCILWYSYIDTESCWDTSFDIRTPRVRGERGLAPPPRSRVPCQLGCTFCSLNCQARVLILELITVCYRGCMCVGV